MRQNIKRHIKGHLKRLTHLAYHKKVDPKLPDQFTPTAVNLNQSFFQKFKGNPLLVFIPLLILIISGASSFYLWRQTTKPKIPAPQVSKNIIVLKEGVLPTPNEKQKGPFSCPGVPSFCKSGEDVYIGSSYIGMGSKIPNRSPIFAAFDGYFEATGAAIASSASGGKVQNIIIGILTDKANLLRAHYYFTGPLPKNKNINIKAGDIIAYSGQAVMPLYQNTNLVFVLTRNDGIMEKRLGGERVRLKSADFKP